MPKHVHDGRRWSCLGCRVLVVSDALERAAENLEKSANILRLAIKSLKEDGVWGEFKPPRPYRMSEATRELKSDSGKRLAEMMKARRKKIEEEIRWGDGRYDDPV